jgi:hypothetical protein
LAKLSQHAQTAGGAVILLFGNHESLNAAGQFQYATDDQEYEQVLGTVLDTSLKTERWRLQFAGNQPARWAAFEPGGLLAHSLMKNMKVAVQVGRTVCVHAGLTAQHLKDNGGLEGMNNEAQEWISHVQHTHEANNNMGDYSNGKQVMGEAAHRSAAALQSMPLCLAGGTGEQSPVWMRDYSQPHDLEPFNARKAQKMLDDCLAKLGGVDRMVMGHTVQRQINCALKGKAWRIDVGASRGVMDGTPEVLEVSLQEGQEVVSVLTKAGKVPGQERQVGVAFSNFF